MNLESPFILYEKIIKVDKNVNIDKIIKLLGKKEGQREL
jgi:hypothetical protein